MSISSNNVITVKGQKDQLNSKNKYSINEDTIIELKGEALHDCTINLMTVEI